MKYSDFL